MIRYLDTRPPVFYVLLFLAFALSAAAAVCARYDFNPTALIRFGHRYAAQNPDLTPENSIRFLGNESNGGNGYDGQIFYYYARTMWMKDRWPQGFSNAYRAPRAGFPLLASLIPLPGNSGQAYAMILTQILLVSLGVWCFAALLPEGSRWMAALYALSPFQLQAFLYLVSDSVMISLFVTGLYLSRRPGLGAVAGSWISFSLAILTKESSLFLLFPIGLFALVRMQLRLALVVLFSLLPSLFWQLYLYQAHGMLPASILSIFLSPLSGIAGVFDYTWQLLWQRPFAGGEFARQSAKWLLIALIPAAGWFSLRSFFGAVETWRDRKTPLPYYAGSLFVLLSILIADYSYFWGIFENVGRMFTPLVPVFLLGAAAAPRSRSFHAACVILLFLAALVWLRAVFMTPSFPFDHYVPYSGPSYPAPPVPQ